jgi:hypothetical protein
VEEVLAILERAAERYDQLGFSGCEAYKAVDLYPKYGCSPLPTSLDLREGEVVLVELNHFEDAEHHALAMDRVNGGGTINALHEQMVQLVDMDRIVRGEFSRVL